MRILYSPQENPRSKINYDFQGETITATIDGVSDTFDFTGLTDGRAFDIKSTLPVNPIVEAIRENGILSVTLLNYISENASDDEKFPHWMEV